MNKLTEIYAGWKHYIFQTPEIEEKAKIRMKICVENCDKLNNRNICSKCGCYMPAKVRSLKSNCLLKKW